MASSAEQVALVTGAAGFVGRHALGPLAAAGYDVHGVALARRDGLPSTATWHTVDLLEPGAPARLVETVRPTHLLHLAWTTEPGAYWTSEANLRWVKASVELLEAFGRAGGRRFVGAGSCAEYDWTTGDLDEGRAADFPATLYGRAKLALCHLATVTAELHGFSSAWGRLFFLYGPYEHPARLVPTVARALLASRPAEVGRGTAERDFSSSEDAGAAFSALVDSEVVGVVNIASGTAVPVGEVVKRVAWLLRGEGGGLLIKESGENVVRWQGYSFSATRICFPDGHIYKIIGDAGPGGANSPGFSDNDFVDRALYVPAIDPARP